MRTFAPAFEQNGHDAGSCPPASLAQLARARDL